MSNAITTVREGKKRLAELESVAGENYRHSKESFDAFVLALHDIREGGFWHYKVDLDGVMLGDYTSPQFKRHYLSLFCREHGISVASVYEHLGTVDTWQALGLPREEIVAPNVGVAAAGGIKEIAHYDRRKQKLILPPAEVLQNLPGSEEQDPVERIRQKVVEVFSGDEPPPPAVIRASFAVDVGNQPEVAYWQHRGGDVWVTYTHGKEVCEVEIIKAAALNKLTPGAFENLRRRLGLQLHE